MVKGLTRAFSCRIFAGRKQTLNTATMDFKRIAHNAVRRWNEKRTARKTMGTTHVATPQAETLPKAANLESTLGGFLAERYEFRFNVLTEATEFRHLSDEGNGTFRPATERDLNAICLEAHRHGIDCWDRDVARMVHSADVREYHPFRQYFQRLPAWDGRDRLHGLAARVSDSPLWVQAFHRWMLGLAAQWAGLSDGLHAHSTAPLLVSDEQGLGKSTFCRTLLPPLLQAYYTDSVDLARPDKVERQLTASHRQHGYRPCANLRPTESGTGKRRTVLVQPRGRERPEAAQRGFLPYLPGRGSVAPLLSCGSAGGEGTPAFAARNFRTVGAVGTRSDGRRDATQAGSGPRGRRSTENTHALRKPVPGGGKMTGVGKRYGWGGYLGVRTPCSQNLKRFSLYLL